MPTIITKSSAKYCSATDEEGVKPSASDSGDLLCCVMPKSLTAEDGAKYLLSGEFHETVTMRCGHCDDGVIDDEVCTECGGAGEYALKVPISWTTIKEIYAMAVKCLAT